MKVLKMAVIFMDYFWMDANLMNKLNNNDMTRGAIGAAIKDGYLKNCHVAFAFDKVNKKYVYPEAYNNAYKFTEKLLNVHPFAVHGIGNVNTNILRLDLLPAFRDTLKLLSTRRENPVSTRLVFGTLDLCVDYKSPFLKELEAVENIAVIPLENQGHESLSEDSTDIGKAAIAFLGEK